MKITLGVYTTPASEDQDFQNEVRSLMTLAGLKEAEKAEKVLERAPVNPFAEYDAAQAVRALANFTQALANGEKIKAIKALREVTSLGLTEAKQFVEQNFFDYRGNW